jgi:hypothetical protein
VLDIRQVSRQINGMTKKHKPRRPAQDESQIALSVVERAIGGKLVAVKPDQTNKRRSSIASNPRKKAKA